MNTTLTSNFGHIVAKYGLDNYRAMLCIARTMLSQMSVCPSVTRRYCAETAKCILKLFAASGSHTYLVFSAPNIMAIFRRGPLIHGGGYEKSRFPIKISLYRSFYSCNSAYVCASKPTDNLFRCCSGEHFWSVSYGLDNSQKAFHYTAVLRQRTVVVAAAAVGCIMSFLTMVSAHISPFVSFSDLVHSSQAICRHCSCNASVKCQ